MIKVDDILLYITGYASPELEAKIQHWMAEDPSHLQQFETYTKVWNQSGSLNQFKVLDSSKAWNKIEHLILDEAPTSISDNQSPAPRNLQSAKTNKSKSNIRPISGAKTNNQRKIRRYAAAASFLLILSLGTFWYLNRSPYIEISTQELAEQNKKSGNSTNELFVLLSDGSKIILDDPAAKVKYPRKFNAEDKERRITLLSGTATFDITPNPNKPFIVESYPAAITVLGTVFSTTSDSIVATVENKEGLVRFSDIVDLENGVEVKEGESFSYDGSEFVDETPKEIPPPPPPAGTLEKIGNIIDKLVWDFPTKIEMSPYMKHQDLGIARIDYDQSLDGIFLQLDSTANFGFTKSGSNYTVWKFTPIDSPK